MNKPIIIPYTPRPYQWEVHKALDDVRWAVVIMHRRAGKSVMLINHLIRKALTRVSTDPNEPPPRYAYIAPYLRQAKSLAWSYIKQYTDPIPGRVYSETELKVTLPNKAEIRLFGADNAEALRGIYLDGCVLDEYAQISPDVFAFILRPALTDRLGWCVFSGTPNGKDHLYKQLRFAEDNEEWFSIVLPASATNIIPKKELDDALRAVGQEAFEREYMCSFDSIMGKKIYPEFARNIHVPKHSIYPEHATTIFRGFDNTGLSPACCLSYLTAAGQFRVFKEFCFSDTGIMEAMEGIVMWCNTMLPQGCRFVDYVDPAGRNRDSMKMSPQDYMVMKAREMGHDMRPIPGIQTWKIRRESVAGRLRKIINGEPAIVIDKTCEILIEGFAGAYAYRELAGMPGQFAEDAVKNHVSHVHDALQYICTRLFLQNDQPKTGSYGDIVDEDEDFYYDSHATYSGKSAVGGY